MYRSQPTTHWCRECILASDPDPKDSITGRIRIPVVNINPQYLPPKEEQKLQQLSLYTLLRVKLFDVGNVLTEQLIKDPTMIYKISPDEFEEFICDRLFAMGFEPKRVGAINRKDGGIDVFFWPRHQGLFPFLGAAQVKHHRDPKTKEGSATVREFAGTIASYPLNAGILVTNTSFSPDAQWFASERAKLVRLRELSDIQRWLMGNFNDNAEWREIPTSIELCPGVIIKIR